MLKQKLMAIAVAVGMSAGAQAYMIDDFNTGDPTQIADAYLDASLTPTQRDEHYVGDGLPTDNNTATPPYSEYTMGGARDLYASRNVTAPNASVGSGHSKTWNCATCGSLKFSQDPSQWGIHSVHWDGNADGVFSTASTGLDEDFTDGGASDTLYIDMFDVDHVYSVSFMVWDTSGLLSQYDWIDVAPHPGGSNHSVLSASLTSFSGSADWSHIAAAQLLIDGQTNVDSESLDGQVDLVKTGSSVPAPATLALMAMGLWGLTLARRRLA